MMSRVVILLCALLAGVRIWNSIISLITSIEAALELHIPHQLLLVGENKVHHSASPHWFLYHVEKEVAISASPDLLENKSVKKRSWQDISSSFWGIMLTTQTF